MFSFSQNDNAVIFLTYPSKFNFTTTFATTSTFLIDSPSSFDFITSKPLSWTFPLSPWENVQTVIHYYASFVVRSPKYWENISVIFSKRSYYFQCIFTVVKLFFFFFSLLRRTAYISSEVALFKRELSLSLWMSRSWWLTKGHHSRCCLNFLVPIYLTYQRSKKQIGNWRSISTESHSICFSF